MAGDEDSARDDRDTGSGWLVGPDMAPGTAIEGRGFVVLLVACGVPCRGGQSGARASITRRFSTRRTRAGAGGVVVPKISNIGLPWMPSKPTCGSAGNCDGGAQQGRSREWGDLLPRDLGVPLGPEAFDAGSSKPISRMRSRPLPCVWEKRRGRYCGRPAFGTVGPPG
ncbi:hypothetical protein GCM10009609_00600 [Pseudonocardia aurantiaca]